jgi:methylenetetrahydrofolate reductase (NADPH)
VSVLDGFSLEITGRDAARLEETAPLLPPGTRVHVAYLAGETLEQRVEAAGAARSLGLTPVPHLAARRLRSRAELEEVLAALGEVGALDELFVVGGDPTTPAGPYADSLAVLRSGALQAAGVRGVGVAGYPDGHPDIARDVLAAALRAKVALLTEHGIAPVVVTQFGFDPQPVLGWIDGLRREGIGAPVRVGVPGPVGIKRLLAYARRFGIATSAGITRKYGFSLANLMGTTGPDAFVAALSHGLEPARHGEVRLHFYTFGGIAASVEWIRNSSFPTCTSDDSVGLRIRDGSSR